ncbi:hypothetical protein EVAR_25511_1 [Eumeta japonica]|uniref:Uncharacterized protein n=1 Tax=Eumeta variegata TaxID=151549 RepID=A0A4C1VMW2_EUMVA|nr:hypothetical protein EVAR_25511_1 [Eumeta japonica]
MTSRRAAGRSAHREAAAPSAGMPDSGTYYLVINWSICDQFFVAVLSVAARRRSAESATPIIKERESEPKIHVQNDRCEAELHLGKENEARRGRARAAACRSIFSRGPFLEGAPGAAPPYFYAAGPHPSAGRGRPLTPNVFIKCCQVSRANLTTVNVPRNV